MTDFIATYGNLIVSMVLGALLGLSLYLPLMAGQLSLASPGFYACGGYIAAILSTGAFKSSAPLFPIPLLLLEMLIAGVVCGILGVLVGIPALRLRGIYLAIATIAFVEVLRVISLNLDITGGAVGIFGIPQPFESAIAYLWVAIPLLLLSMLLLYRLEQIKVGRAFAAIRDDELAADAMGINPTYYKVLAFTLGAILAGMVGAISAHFLNTWNARQGTFDASIIYLTFVLIGGSRSFVGTVLGGMVFTALPEVLRAIADTNGLPMAIAQFLRDGRLIIFGLLIVLGTIFFPQGLVTPELLKKATIMTPSDPILAVSALTRSFGGLVAVNNVSFTVDQNEVFGLIGPNGAGKTTLFNLISGLIQPSSGQLLYQGESITKLRPHNIAKLGIARTFQNIRLFGTLSALENIIVARHIHTKSNVFTGVLSLPSAAREEAITKQQSLELLQLVGLGDRAQEIAVNFSYGDQRRLEIARALALKPKILLLDEPAAGMNTNEKQSLSLFIRQISHQFNLTIVLIEHHVPLVMGLCDRIAVLNFGKLIALGNPYEVKTDPVVIEAYLGAEK